MDRRSFPGFTLIELLIVMAIIAVIAAVTIPTRVRSIVLAREATGQEIIALRNAEAVAAQLEQGHVIWSVPRAFRLRRVEAMVVRLTPTELLKGESSRRLFQVTARLVATEGFNVKLLSQEVQTLGPTAPIKWAWLIEPQKAGEHQLGLAVDVCDEPDLCQSVVAWRTGVSGCGRSRALRSHFRSHAEVSSSKARVKTRRERGASRDNARTTALIAGLSIL